MAAEGELPDRTPPGWCRCTPATILPVLQRCGRSTWGRPWIGPWGWALQAPLWTSSCPYFSPEGPLLLPFLLLPLRPEGVRSGLPHTRPGIHRAQPASPRTLGHPSCAGPPCESPHNILGTCSSGGVCACWLGWRCAERSGTLYLSLSLSLSLSLLPPQITRSTLLTARGALSTDANNTNHRNSTDFPFLTNPVTLLSIPLQSRKRARVVKVATGKRDEIKNGYVVFLFLI